MLLLLAEYLAKYFHGFHAFQYTTTRGIMAALTALIISLVFGFPVVKWLERYTTGQPIRHDGPQRHLSKTGTPTMGGALILVAITVSMLLWANLTNRYVWVTLFVIWGFGLIGWIDDYLKQSKKNSKGLVAKWKFLCQSLIGLAAVLFLYFTTSYVTETQFIVPLFKNVVLNLGLAYIFISYFVVVGTSNAVNLTDGLDGLAIMPTVLVAAGLGVFAYLSSNFYFAKYLFIPFLPGAGEMAVLCCAIVGAGLGFLWFNTYPAEMFMGDVGSLGIGAALGIIAVIIRQELVLMIMGGIFVVETISVILQVGSYKLRGKRLFKMAPIHHHFELKGWAEPKIIVRFWLITFILVLLGLATLKLR